MLAPPAHSRMDPGGTQRSGKLRGAPPECWFRRLAPGPSDPRRIDYRPWPAERHPPPRLVGASWRGGGPAVTKRLQEPRARGGAESSPFFLLGVFGSALHASASLQAAPRPVPSEMCAGGVARRPGAPRRRRHKGRAAVTSPTRRCRQQGGGPGPTGGARGCPSPSPSTPVPPRAWQRPPPPMVVPLRSRSTYGYLSH